MEIKQKLWNKGFCDSQTYLNNKNVNKMRSKLNNYDTDSDNKERKESRLCKYCYYINNSRLAYQAFTHTNCSICFEEMIFATGDIDKLCKSCSIDTGMCVHCGAKID